MTKEDLYEELEHDCFIYFCRIVDCNNGNISGEDIKYLNSKIIKLYDKAPKDIDECLKQYDSLICELKFVLQMIREKKKVECLEGNRKLHSIKGINGPKQLDFLIDGGKICEVSSIKEIKGFRGETGTGMAVAVDSNKANLISQVEQKLEGESRRDGASGQIEMFLRNNPSKSANIVFYLPYSFDEKYIKDAIFGEEVSEVVVYSNGATKWRKRKKDTVNKRGRAEIQPLSSLIKKYLSRVKFIFVMNKRIFYITEKKGTLSLGESGNIGSLLE